MYFFVSLFLLFFTVSSGAFAAADLCDVINIPNCRGVTKQLRRNTFQTAPTSSTAVNLNPANVSFDRGVGLDMIAQAHNPVFFSLTSGTGKMGGALISGSLENSFFGNRIPELDPDFLDRNENLHQYKNKKLSVALGAKIVSNKKFGLDFGLILRRHPDIKKINSGAGLSGRMWKFHFGASAYQDDMFIDLRSTINPMTGLPYSVTMGTPNIKQSFLVTTLTAGTRIQNLSLDVGTIRSNIKYYNQVTNILIYSASYNYENFLFNLAMRKEHSAALEYQYKDKTLGVNENKSQVYAGVQYSLNKHVIMGINYNYFLLRELSLSATLFI